MEASVSLNTTPIKSAHSTATATSTQRAAIIQTALQRKHDLHILNAIELLLELPTVTTSKPTSTSTTSSLISMLRNSNISTNPQPQQNLSSTNSSNNSTRKYKDGAEQDILTIKQHFTIFTPSDFDDLVEERNISANRCGYVLCANPPPKRSGRPGCMRVMAGGRVVEERLTTRYCGADCARRSLYLRTQLDEEPGWMRKGRGGDIKMYGEEAVQKVQVDGEAGPVPIKEREGVERLDDGSVRSDKVDSDRDSVKQQNRRRRGRRRRKDSDDDDEGDESTDTDTDEEEKAIVAEDDKEGKEQMSDDEGEGENEEDMVDALERLRLESSLDIPTR